MVGVSEGNPSPTFSVSYLSLHKTSVEDESRTDVSREEPVFGVVDERGIPGPSLLFPFCVVLSFFTHWSFC